MNFKLMKYIKSNITIFYDGKMVRFDGKFNDVSNELVGVTGQYQINLFID